MVSVRGLAMICFLAIGPAIAGDRALGKPPTRLNFSELPTANQLRAFERAAYEGSGAAANSLSTFYMKADKSGQLERYWTGIAAQNGDPVGEYNLAHYYLDRQSPHKSIERARFWLKKSAAMGNQMAKARLAGELRIE
jgi:TPR repeat protein